MLAALTCFVSFSRARGEAERGAPSLAAELFCFDESEVATSGAAPPELWGHRDRGGAIDPPEGKPLLCALRRTAMAFWLMLV